MNKVEAGRIPVKMVSTVNKSGYSKGYSTSRINNDKLPITIIRKKVIKISIIFMKVFVFIFKIEYVYESAVFTLLILNT